MNPSHDWQTALAGARTSLIPSSFSDDILDEAWNRPRPKMPCFDQYQQAHSRWTCGLVDRTHSRAEIQMSASDSRPTISLPLVEFSPHTVLKPLLILFHPTRIAWLLRDFSNHCLAQPHSRSTPCVWTNRTFTSQLQGNTRSGWTPSLKLKQYLS